MVNASVAKAGRFLFKWDFVPNAGYYRLMKSVDGKQPYQQVGEKLLTNSTTEDISTFEQDWANANYIVQACDAEGCSLSNKIYSGNVMLDMIAYVKDKAFSQKYDELVKSSMNSNISSLMTIHETIPSSFNIYQKINFTQQCSVSIPRGDGTYMAGVGSCPSAYQKNFLFSNTVSGDDWRFVESNDSKPKSLVTYQD
ncbi:MAG TPA: hypothetical protein PLY05_12470, partial [Agitococcus sp.]|nr:hypothetical protein [Agitococcus sp.]